MINRAWAKQQAQEFIAGQTQFIDEMVKSERQNPKEVEEKRKEQLTNFMTSAKKHLENLTTHKSNFDLREQLQHGLRRCVAELPCTYSAIYPNSNRCVIALTYLTNEWTCRWIKAPNQDAEDLLLVACLFQDAVDIKLAEGNRLSGKAAEKLKNHVLTAIEANLSESMLKVHENPDSIHIPLLNTPQVKYLLQKLGVETSILPKLKIGLDHNPKPVVPLLSLR